MGPLYGAALTAASTWRAIFYVNMPLAAVIAVGVRGPRREHHVRDTLKRDLLGGGLALLCAAAAVLAIAAPPALADSVSVGTAFTPLVAGVGFSSPVAIVALLSGLAFIGRELTAGASVRPLLQLRGAPAGTRGVDWPGGLLVALVLAFVVVSFASADPRSGVVGDDRTASPPRGRGPRSAVRGP